LAAGTAADYEHPFHTIVAQALAQNGLSGHAGGPEKNDLHGSPLIFPDSTHVCRT
jgi:hypothetical protein